MNLFLILDYGYRPEIQTMWFKADRLAARHGLAMAVQADVL